MRLDAHQHFWIYDRTEYPWVKHDWPIRRDFLPPELEPLLKKSGFDGSIAVQARQSQEETRWLLALAQRFEFIKGVVGWVNLRDERIEEDLKLFTENPKFVGVRHVVQDEPDDKFMLQADFLRGISQLKKCNLAYDILIFPRQLPAAIELVKRFPEQRFVLDHIAKPEIKQGVISPWREQIIELASYPNVVCKLSGVVTEADWGGWKDADFEPYLKIVSEAFGFDRLMYGSDWPVCLLSAKYEDTIRIVKHSLAELGNSEIEAVFGGNARRFYLERGKQ